MKALNLITDPKSYREHFKYIQLREGYFYATNGHILLKLPDSEVFPANLLAELDSEMYFEGSNWKDAKVASMATYRKVGDSFELLDNKMKFLGYLKPIKKEDFENKLSKYPDCNNVLYKSVIQNEDTKEVALNPELLDTLYKANGKKHLKLGFYGQNKGIKVSFQESEAEGLLMPMLLF